MIRWRKQDAARLANVVKRFNAKIDRIKRGHPEKAAYLPQKQSTKELTRQLKELPRSEFNRKVKSLERFLRRGAEGLYTTKAGVNITVWQKKEIDNTFRSINARRRAMAKKHQPSTEKGTMGAIKEFALQPRKNTVQTIQPKNFAKFVEHLEKQQMSNKPLRYKENYLKAIENVFGKGDLYTRIQAISPEQLVDLYYSDPVLQIGFVYDPKEAKEIESYISNRLPPPDENAALPSAQPGLPSA